MLSYQSFQYDGLTELYNRNALDIYAQQYFRNEPDEPATVVFIDIDYFKDFNDANGHQIGDVVLKSAAREIEIYLGANSIMGRNGGDEFLIILKERTPEAAEQEITRLFNARHEIMLNGKTYEYSYSIGYVSYPEQGILYHDLARKANRAMYHVKLNGRAGMMHYEPEMLEEKGVPFLSYHDVIDFLPGAAVAFSTDEKTNVLYASDEFASYFKYSSLDELWRSRSREFLELICKESRDKVSEVIEKARNEKGRGYPLEISFKIEDREGKILDLSGVCSLRDSIMTGEIIMAFVHKRIDGE